MSVSIEATSVSPTPPFHQAKPHMNGGVGSRSPLNISTVSATKHNLGLGNSLYPSSGSAGTGGGISGPGNTTLSSSGPGANSSNRQLLDVSKASSLHQLNLSRRTLRSPSRILISTEDNHSNYQTLASLALLCLLSLLMAFLALLFLQKIGPDARTTDTESKSDSSSSKGGSHHSSSHHPPRMIVISTEEYNRVSQVSVALSTLTISLNLCCLFVCCIQFLLAIKLMKTTQGEERTHKFLKRSSPTRVLAIGGFFLSIPIFFTGVILFTFISFEEVSAFATSVVIGLGIVFCGVASVQNVYLWQWEKTRASKELAESKLSELRESAMALDGTLHQQELSTLV